MLPFRLHFLRLSNAAFRPSAEEDGQDRQEPVSGALIFRGSVFFAFFLVGTLGS
jgi:hypothetical protein